MNTFEQGATVYLLDGRECEYVATANDRHIVRPIYDTDQGPWLGQDEIVSGVFVNPPTERLQAEVRDLEDKIAALRASHMEATREVSDSEREVKQRIARLAKFKTLERIEDYIEGRITHFVVTHEYGLSVEVQTADEALKTVDRYVSKDMRLLCLFGNTKGDFTWRVNRWSDGSGSWEEKQPFCSEGEAIEYAREICRDRLAAAVSQTHTGQWGSLFDSCRKLGLVIPQAMLDRHQADQQAGAKKAVEDAKAKLAQAEARLAEVTP